VTEARGAVAFAEALCEGGLVAAVVDLELDWADGLDVLASVRRRHPQAIAIARTGVPVLAAEAWRVGAVDVAGRGEAGWLAIVHALEAAGVDEERAPPLPQPDTKEPGPRPPNMHLRPTQPIRGTVTLALVKDEAVKPTPTTTTEALVGHDLQEPLRSVANYLGVIEHRHARALPQEALVLLQKARAAAGRMQERVATTLALLDGAEPLELDETEAEADANAVLIATLHDLDAAIAKAGAEVTQDPLPPVPLPAAELQQLLQNLVGNALKFRSKRKPKVHVSGRTTSEGVEISVRDNGIGVAAADRARIFQLFERGTGSSDLAGTGIGLNLCQRIVVRRGGRIWVESEPGHGATFFVALPQRAAPSEGLAS
jgi:signal transduction histidine kinase